MDSGGVFFVHKHGTEKKHRKRNHGKNPLPKAAASECLGDVFQCQKMDRAPEEYVLHGYMLHGYDHVNCIPQANPLQ